MNDYDTPRVPPVSELPALPVVSSTLASPTSNVSKSYQRVMKKLEEQKAKDAQTAVAVATVPN